MFWKGWAKEIENQLVQAAAYCPGVLGAGKVNLYRKRTPLRGITPLVAGEQLPSHPSQVHRVSALLLERGRSDHLSLQAKEFTLSSHSKKKPFWRLRFGGTAQPHS